MHFLEKKCVKELAFKCLYEEHSLFYKKAIKKIQFPRSMIPVTGSGRILPETAFFPAFSCRFPPDPAGKAPEDGSSIPVGTSSYAETGKSGKFPLPDSIRKQEGSERETSRKSTFPFGTWPEKFVSQPDAS